MTYYIVTNIYFFWDFLGTMPGTIPGEISLKWKQSEKVEPCPGVAILDSCPGELHLEFVLLLIFHLTSLYKPKSLNQTTVIFRESNISISDKTWFIEAFAAYLVKSPGVLNPGSQS